MHATKTPTTDHLDVSDKTTIDENEAALPWIANLRYIHEPLGLEPSDSITERQSCEGLPSQPAGFFQDGTEMQRRFPARRSR